MYQINFDSPVQVHFIGIGGISMSGLAEVLLQEGFTISGSDSQRSELTRHLEEKGATVFYGQTADNIKPGIDVVVYTAAIHPDNAEFAAARSAGIPMLTRAELLGEIMRNYKTAIAVAGTHGKTTTTSMISMILLEAQADPTISVGGILPEIGGNIRVGRSDLFILIDRAFNINVEQNCFCLITRGFIYKHKRCRIVGKLIAEILNGFLAVDFFIFQDVRKHFQKVRFTTSKKA